MAELQAVLPLNWRSSGCPSASCSAAALSVPRALTAILPSR